MSEPQTKYKAKVKPNLKRLEAIYRRSQRLSKLYHEQSMKEPNLQESYRLADLYHLHHQFLQRGRDLSFRLQFPHRFGDESILKDFENKSAINFRKTQKEEKRIKFETQHRIQVWFGHTSLGADYGKFTCEKCGYTFYHSPSGVKLGKVQKYVCICGECVNAILKRDGLKELFE